MAWYPWHKPRLEDIFHEPNENVQRQKKFFDYEDSFVTTKMLQTIKIDMKNLEHAKIILNILEKNPDDKYDIELEFLKEAFENIEFFETTKKDLTSSEFLLVLRQLKAEHHTAGSPLYHFGDWGDKFYIILQGAVYILTKQNPEQPTRKASRKGSDEADKERKHETNVFRNKTSLREEEKLRAMRKAYPGFIVGKILEAGAAFGESALQNKSRRSTIAVCKENTVLGVLTREEYNELLCISK